MPCRGRQCSSTILLPFFCCQVPQIHVIFFSRAGSILPAAKLVFCDGILGILRILRCDGERRRREQGNGHEEANVHV